MSGNSQNLTENTRRFRVRAVLTRALDLLLTLQTRKLRLERQLDPESNSPLGRLDHESVVVHGRRDREALARWLRSALRRVPYWSRGHEQLGLVALDLQDIAVAYACAQALEQLDPGSYAGRLILGRCFLARGASERAVLVFEELLRRFPADIAVHEDLAASYLAIGRTGEARTLLHALPENARTSHISAALSYLNKREN